MSPNSNNIFIFTLLISALVATVNTFPFLTPNDKELVFKIETITIAENLQSSDKKSSFTINGLMFVQSHDNSIDVKISELVHHTFQDNNTKEIEEFQKPFSIIYNKDGSIKEFITERDDKEYSRNFKRGLASLLQFDQKVLKNTSIDNPSYVYSSKEQSLYGDREVTYSVIKRDDKTNEIYKFYNKLTNGQNLYIDYIKNIEPASCEGNGDQLITSNVQKKYVVKTFEDDEYVITNILSDSCIVYAPFEGQSDINIITTKINISLQEQLSVTRKLELNSNYTESSIYYIQGNTTENGRRINSVKELNDELNKKLDESVQLLERNAEENINASPINDLQQLLQYHSFEDLQDLYNNLSKLSETDSNNKKKFELFQNILPLIGTKASALLIKVLIIDQKVDDDTAISFLQQLPNQIQPDEDLISQLNEFQDYIDRSEEVQKNAILCFGSLISKAVDNSKKLIGKETKLQKDEIIKLAEKPYNKFIVKFVERLKRKEIFEAKMIYLQAIFNMKLESSLDYLKPGLEGKWSESRDVRIHILWAISAVISDPETALKIYWPIIIDAQAFTELRMAAYYLLMETRPNPTQIDNIVWYFNELYKIEEEIYNFHYTYIESRIKTVDNCQEQFKKHLTSIFKYLNKPLGGGSFVQVHDYKDSQYSFGGGWQNIFIKTPKMQIRTFTIRYQLFHNFYDEIIYLKISGLDEILDLKFYEDDSLINVLTEVVKSFNVHIEIAHITQNRVVKSYFIDNTNLEKLKAKHVEPFIMKPIKKSFTSIKYARYEKLLMATELGLPVIWDFLVPVAQKIDFMLNLDILTTTRSVALELLGFRTVNYRHGLSVYNSVTDMWVGIHRRTVYSEKIPIAFNLDINYATGVIHITWKRRTDDRNNILEIKSHSTTETFCRKDYLSGSLTTEWKNYITFLEDDSLDLGHKWHIGTYHHDHKITKGSIKDLFLKFQHPNNKNFIDSQDLMVLYVQNLFSCIVLSPQQGNHGFIIRIEPSTIFNVTEIEIMIGNPKKPDEVLEKPIVLADLTYGLPFITTKKNNIHLKYLVKNGKNILKQWQLDYNSFINEAHNKATFNLSITKESETLISSLCINAEKYWGRDNVLGYLNITPGLYSSGQEPMVEIEMKGETSKNLRSIEGSQVKNYSLNIKTGNNIPNELTNILEHFLDDLKGNFYSYYIKTVEMHDELGNNNYLVGINLSDENEEVSIYLKTSKHSYGFYNVPLKRLRWLGQISDNTIYSEKFLSYIPEGRVKTCEIHHNYYKLHNGTTIYQSIDKEEPPLEKALNYAGANARYLISSQLLDNNKITLKFYDVEHVIDIIPLKDSFEIKMNGTLLPDQEYFSDSWLMYIVNKSDNIVHLAAPRHGLHIIYDSNSINVMAADLLLSSRLGLCFPRELD